MQTEAALLPAHASFEHAHALLASRNVRAALAAFDEAEGRGYSSAECAAGRWQCWMLLGAFERAWAESDTIERIGAADPHRFWNGQSWNGRHLMLRCLHGLGDTINFIRYAPVLRETCRSLTVQAHPELVRLLQNIPSIDHVLSWNQPEPHWDLQMEVNELPRIFRTAEQSIPRNVPYIPIPDQKRAWAQSVIPSTNAQRIGLVWRAGPYDPSRSIALAELAPLLDTPNAVFYSLQQNPEPELAKHYSQIYDLHARAGISDVLDTAALLNELDLVISVDTMTAHLAGALAKPLWLILPERADWRWMLRRNDSPWYPSARLFRQPDALSCIHRELQATAPR